MGPLIPPQQMRWGGVGGEAVLWRVGEGRAFSRMPWPFCLGAAHSLAYFWFPPHHLRLRPCHQSGV